MIIYERDGYMRTVIRDNGSMGQWVNGTIGQRNNRAKEQ